MTISTWEKVKRIVAHAFEMKTKLEIKEHYERLQWEEEQKRLRAAHLEHIRTLMIEHADEIEQFHKERKERIRQEEIEAELKLIKEEENRRLREAVELYRSNRPLQRTLLYGEVTETSTHTEE